MSTGYCPCAYELPAQKSEKVVALPHRDAGSGDGGLTSSEREELTRLRREKKRLVWMN